MSLPVRLLAVPQDRTVAVPAPILVERLRQLGVLGMERRPLDANTRVFAGGAVAAFEEEADAEYATFFVTSSAADFVCVRSESIEEIRGVCACGVVLWRAGDGACDFVCAVPDRAHDRA